MRDPAALHRAPEELTEAETRGRRLYLSTCISCHETGAKDDAVAWDTRPVSYPMDGHDCVSCHDRSRYPERGLVPLPPPASYHGAADDVYTVIAGLGGRSITRGSLHRVFAAAVEGSLEPVTFLDLDHSLVDRVLAREREHRRSGPIAEGILRDLGVVAAKLG